jgi:hypothetical protein
LHSSGENPNQSVANKFGNDYSGVAENQSVANYPQKSHPSQIIREQHQAVNPICDGATDGNWDSGNEQEVGDQKPGASDSERRTIDAAEWAAQAKALEAESAKSKALPNSRPGEAAGPTMPPILGYTGGKKGIDRGYETAMPSAGDDWGLTCRYAS